MFERIKRLYDTGRIGLPELITAVEKKLITAEQFEEICGRDYEHAKREHDGYPEEPTEADDE